MKKRKVLQASFRLADKFEAELLKYAESQGDVSKYIKRLIYVDKEGFRKAAEVPAVEPARDDVINDAMKSVSL